MQPASARIAGLGVYLPETTRSTEQTERDLRAANPDLKLATGLIGRMTGVRTVHLRPDGWQTSDLAVAAARDALAESPGEIDLLLFASASQDLIEPATSHIVAAKLGGAELRNTQKEHAAAGRKIDKLNGQIAELHERMAVHDQSDYTGIGALADELRALQSQLETVETRWLELEELLA